MTDKTKAEAQGLGLTWVAQAHGVSQWSTRRFTSIQIAWPFLFSVQKIQLAGNINLRSIIKENVYNNRKTPQKGSTCLKPTGQRLSERAGSCHIEKEKDMGI